MRDVHFIAMFAGMHFMNGDLSEADRIFSETAKRDINYAESLAIHYRPKQKPDTTKICEACRQGCL